MQDLIKYVENVQKTLERLKTSNDIEATLAINFMIQYCEHILPYLVMLRGKSSYTFFQHIDWLLFYRYDLAEAAVNSLKLSIESFYQKDDFIDVVEQIAQALIEHSKDGAIQEFLNAEKVRSNFYLFLTIISCIIVALTVAFTLSNVNIGGTIVVALSCAALPAMILGAIVFSIRKQVALFQPSAIENNIKNYHNDICAKFNYLSSIDNVKYEVEEIKLNKNNGAFTQGQVLSYQRYESSTDTEGFRTEKDDGTRVVASNFKKCEIISFLRSRAGLFKDNSEDTISKRIGPIQTLKL